MNLEKMLIENRISLLRSKDPVMNAKIIRKLERKLRKLRNCETLVSQRHIQQFF